VELGLYPAMGRAPCVMSACDILFCGGDGGSDAQGEFAFADRIQQRKPERNRVHLDRNG